MNNEDTQFENLENLTTEELESRVNALDNNNSQSTIEEDWQSKYLEAQAKAEEAQKRANMMQRLLNKKDKPINNTNKVDSNDLAEIKQFHRTAIFAETAGITKAQAEQVLKYNPNATAESLKDPVVSAIITTMARQEKVENATPRSSSSNTINGKTFKDMTRDERAANWAKIVGGN